MADSLTPNYNLILPEEGGSDDTWAGKVNANFTAIDILLLAMADAIAALPVLPAGGLQNQILTKASNTDYDFVFTSEPTLNGVKLSLTAALTLAQGEIGWNATDGTVDIGLGGAISPLHIGQTQQYRVRNASGASIPKGTLVQYAGTTGNTGRLLVAPWNGTVASNAILGLAADDIANNTDGYITRFGKVRNIDTDGSPYGQTWADGDTIYAAPGGGLTNIMPAAPSVKTIVGNVVHAAQNGIFFVRVVRGSSLGEDELVELDTLVDGDILVYNAATERFENQQPAGGGGGEVAIADEGSVVTAAVGTIDFVGAGVTTTEISPGVVQVAIPGGGGGGGGASLGDTFLLMGA